MAIDMAAALKLGPGDAPGTDICPMISPAAKERAEGLVQSGVDQGAPMVLDGRDATVAGHEGGNWFGPTILSGVTSEMDCYQEEIFAPVMTCMEVDTLDDAL